MNSHVLSERKPFSPLFVPPQRALQRTCACGQHSNGGECEACRKKRESTLQHAIVGASLAKRHGQSERAEAERGHDFSRIANRHPLSNLAPAKATGEIPETMEEKPSPAQGSATIQCNGSGGYEIVYNSYENAKCGTKSCVTAHEGSHKADWSAKWPTGCKGQAKGYLPKGDPPDDPLMTVAEYQTFLKASECKAHTADLTCAEALPKPKECEKTVNDYISLTKTQKANWCP